MAQNRRHIVLIICCLCLMQLLLSCGGGGGGGSSSGNNSTVSDITSFAAIPGDNWVSLSWVNPVSNFSGVMVRRGATCPATPSSGSLVSDTTAATALDYSVINGTSYCYTAFVYNSSGSYSSGATAYATPKASYVAVSAGGIHTLAIKSDGTLWAWGFNDQGELGDGCVFAQTCNNRYSPGQVGSEHTWWAVSGGTAHSVALKQDGTLWSWGDNSSGQIGTGCSGSPCFYYSTPTQITPDTDWVSISAGGFFTAAIKTDGTLWAWGNNYAGQLGDGCVKGSSCVSKATPTTVNSDTDWAAVAAGANHVLALKTNGTLWAWGINDYGELGNAAQSPTAYSSVPVQIGTDMDWKTIAVGDMHSLAIKTNGTLWSWGDNSYGQLGVTCLASCLTVSAPIQVGTDADWKDVDGGNSLTLALKTNGSVWAWGNISLSTGASSSVPHQVGTGTSWSKISAGGGGGTSGIGGGHFMALQSMSPGGYVLMGWGANMQGALGIGTAYPVWSPTEVH